MLISIQAALLSCCHLLLAWIKACRDSYETFQVPFLPLSHEVRHRRAWLGARWSSALSLESVNSHPTSTLSPHPYSGPALRITSDLCQSWPLLSCSKRLDTSWLCNKVMWALDVHLDLDWIETWSDLIRYDSSLVLICAAMILMILILIMVWSQFDLSHIQYRPKIKLHTWFAQVQHKRYYWR